MAIRKKAARKPAAKSSARHAAKPAAKSATKSATKSAAKSAARSAAPGMGATIRQLRQIKGLKLRELADRVGCSESLVSKVEKGVAAPSLSVLHSMARALGVTIGALVDGAGADLGIVSRPGQRPKVAIDRDGSVLERLVPPEGRFQLEGNLHILAPGAGSEGTLSHRGEEVGFVVDGELELTVGAQTFRLAAGDSFVFRSETPHSYRNPGRRRARVVWVSTPPTF
jgi:transcriptional regulator with XRE-family HTH domain